MSLVIGLDTGGTYTDAALFDADQGLCAPLQGPDHP